MMTKTLIHDNVWGLPWKPSALVLFFKKFCSLGEDEFEILKEGDKGKTSPG